MAAMGRAHAIVPRVEATATDIPKRPVTVRQQRKGRSETGLPSVQAIRPPDALLIKMARECARGAGTRKAEGPEGPSP